MMASAFGSTLTQSLKYIDPLIALELEGEPAPIDPSLWDSMDATRYHETLGRLSILVARDRLQGPRGGVPDDQAGRRGLGVGINDIYCHFDTCRVSS